MINKQVQKLKDNIILSIQYSRLKEEISDTNDKIVDIQTKKFDLAKTKKIELNENYIKKVKEAINKIEKNSKYKYNLYETNQLELKLKLLSKQKNYENIKYNIAIATILDHEVEYSNTDDYLEVISTLLFNDKNRMKEIEKELCKIYGILSNKKQLIQNEIIPIDINGAIIVNKAKIMLPKLKEIAVKAAKGVAKNPKIFVASGLIGLVVAVSGKVIISKRKQKKLIKDFKFISNEDLEYLLLINAFSLKVLKVHMDEIEYHKYFKTQMHVINALKKQIHEELFIRWFDKENNYQKIMLLNRFDEYLIKYVNFGVDREK